MALWSLQLLSGSLTSRGDFKDPCEGSDRAISLDFGNIKEGMLCKVQAWKKMLPVCLFRQGRQVSALHDHMAAWPQGLRSWVWQEEHPGGEDPRKQELNRSVSGSL